MKKLALLTLGLLVAACGETPTEIPTTDAPPVAMNFANAPAASGIVVRGDVAVGNTWVDANTGLRIILGADIKEFCADPANYDFDLVDFQHLQISDSRIVEVAKGTVQTSVWEAGPFDCALFLAGDPIASGESHLIVIDNDLNGNQEGENNVNSWGWSANGQLDLTDGGTANLSFKLRVVWRLNWATKAHISIDLK